MADLEPISMNGYAEIIDENRFFYVPDPGFIGSDYFLYTVDDSRSNDARYALYDQAYVVVQVGEEDGIILKIAL